MREAALASEVVVDHAGDRGLAHPHDQVAVAHPGQHPRPRRLVVEHLTGRGHVGQVHQHVVLVHVHLAVLHILRMHEHDGIDHADVSQHGGADQTIEVGTGNQAVGFGTHGKNLLLLTVQQRAPPIGQYLPSRAGCIPLADMRPPRPYRRPGMVHRHNRPCQPPGFSPRGSPRAAEHR